MVLVLWQEMWGSSDSKYSFYSLKSTVFLWIDGSYLIAACLSRPLSLQGSWRSGNGEAQGRKEREKGMGKVEEGGEERPRSWREGEVEVGGKDEGREMMKYQGESA